MRRENAGDTWTAEQWQEYRDAAAAHLAADPGWIVGPAVVAMCDWHLAQLRTPA